MTQANRKLKIPRKKWLKGEESDNSYLLRSKDEKMCCLGLYLQELGVPGSQLRGIQDPTPGLVEGIEEASWLIDTSSIYNRPSVLACKMMNLNDQKISVEIEFTEQEREERLKSLFLEAGVEVEFV